MIGRSSWAAAGLAVEDMACVCLFGVRKVQLRVLVGDLRCNVCVVYLFDFDTAGNISPPPRRGGRRLRPLPEAKDRLLLLFSPTSN